MRVYLAGPMRGLPEYNAPEFRDAAARLREAGHSVWSPLESDEEHGGSDAAAAEIAQTFARDLQALLTQDAVVLLPGWADSHGACLERHAADVVGIPVFLYAPENERLLVPLMAHDWRWRAARASKR
jgi:GT2 family glycosyltransferase